MKVPDDLRYSPDHQWVRPEQELWRVGITDFAQDALGEVTLVRLFDSASSGVGSGEEMGEIEAFKAMTDLYMPANASLVAVNPALATTPNLVNADPYGQGWLCTVRPHTPADLDSLLDAAAYRELIGYTDG